ncbi:unknown [Bacteroides sp. CAG:633]|nr:unknown [Bacteroides sp. CAG:633]
MKLYHASDIVIENPDVYHSRERINMYFRITYIL